MYHISPNLESFPTYGELGANDRSSTRLTKSPLSSTSPAPDVSRGSLAWSETHPVNASQDLLHYLPYFRAVVCKTCGFAVQPNAISRHLKEKHKLYRGNRQTLLDETAKLRLVSPSEVSQPARLDTPVPYLPVLEGFACTHLDCGFLCTSTKRMQQHWTSSHQRPYADEGVRSALVQTLFRGTCLHYFEVINAQRTVPIARHSHSATPQLNTVKSPPSGDELMQILEKGNRDEIRPLAQAVTQGAAPAMTPKLSDYPHINMSDLKLLHHFVTITSPTLYRGGPKDYYTHDVPQMANRCTYLMQGLLALAATHLAMNVSQDERKQYIHVSSVHQLRSLPQYKAEVASSSEENLCYVVAYSRALMVTKNAIFSLTYEDNSTGKGFIWADYISYIRLTCSNTKMVRTILNQFDEVGRLSWILPARQTRGTESPPYSQALRGLEASLASSTESLAVIETLRVNLHVLHEAFAAASSDAITSGWDGLLTWSLGCSPLFIDLLERKERHSLVLMAYFCVLIKNVTDFWYMANHDKMTLSLVAKAAAVLDHTLDWPREQVFGLE